VLTHDVLELQRIDTLVDQLTHRRATLAERAAHRARAAELAAADSRAAAIAARIDELEAAIGELERQGADIATHRTRLEAQLRTVIAPREAEALMHELEALAARRDALDDVELGHLEEQAALDTEGGALTKARPALDAGATSAAAALVAVEAAIDDEIDGLRAARVEVVGRLDAAMLARYERLRTRLGGVAVGRLEGARCSGCHLDLSTAEAAAVRKAGPGQLSDCPQCGRLLVA